MVPEGLALDALQPLVTVTFQAQQFTGYAGFNGLGDAKRQPVAHRLKALAKLSAVDATLRALVAAEWQALVRRLGVNGEGLLECRAFKFFTWDYDSNWKGPRMLPFGSLAEAHSALAKSCIYCHSEEKHAAFFGLTLLPTGSRPGGAFSSVLVGNPSAVEEGHPLRGRHIAVCRCERCSGGYAHLQVCSFSFSAYNARPLGPALTAHGGDFSKLPTQSRLISEAVTGERLLPEPESHEEIFHPYSFLIKAPLNSPVAQRALAQHHPAIDDAVKQCKRAWIECGLVRNAQLEHEMLEGVRAKVKQLRASRAIMAALTPEARRKKRCRKKRSRAEGDGGLR